MLQPAPSPGPFLQMAEWLMSAIGGALVVLVAFRTKIALMDRRINARKQEIEELDRELTKRLDTFDRRQMLMLEIVADIARKVGVDARFSDALVRFLSEEARPRGRGVDDASGRDD